MGELKVKIKIINGSLAIFYLSFFALFSFSLVASQRESVEDFLAQFGIDHTKLPTLSEEHKSSSVDEFLAFHKQDRMQKQDELKVTIPFEQELEEEYDNEEEQKENEMLVKQESTEDALQLDFEDQEDEVAPKCDVSQGHLQRQMVKYLKKEEALAKNQEDKESRQKVTQEVENSKGFCAGLVTLWSYGKVIEGEEKSKEGVIRDDARQFKKIIQKLSQWNGVDDFSPQDKKEIESLISNVLMYQQTTARLFKAAKMFTQLELDVSLYDTKRGFPQKVFDQEAIVTRESLEKHLEKIIRPNTIILLGVRREGLGGHVVAAYQNPRTKKLYFYDPNEYYGEVEVETIKELTEKYWRSTESGSFFSGFGGIDPLEWILRRTSITVFQFPSFGQISYDYPSEKEFELSDTEVKDLFKEGSWFNSPRYRNSQDEFIVYLRDRLNDSKE